MCPGQSLHLIDDDINVFVSILVFYLVVEIKIFQKNDFRRQTETDNLTMSCEQIYFSTKGILGFMQLCESWSRSVLMNYFVNINKYTLFVS